MTLRDLLKVCRYKDIFNVLHKEYYKDVYPKDKIQEADYGYRKVFEELLMLPDKLNEEYQIYICKKTDDLDGEEFIDVSFYCHEDEEVYAMDLTPWADLIDAEIKIDIELNNAEISAHILWEVTFYGFTQDHVILEKERLEDLIKKIENGEEKLIPWVDIAKELGLDDET